MSKTYLLQNLPTNMTNSYIDNLENTSLYDSLNLSGGAMAQEGGLFKKDPAKEAEKKKKKNIKKCENYKRNVEDIKDDIRFESNNATRASARNRPEAEERALKRQFAHQTKLDKYKETFKTKNPNLECDTVLADKKAEEAEKKAKEDAVIAEKKAEEDAKIKQMNDELEEEKRKKEQDIINDNILAVFHTVARSNTPFWFSNLGVTFLTIFFGFSYQILINNEDFLMYMLFFGGILLIMLFKMGVGFLPRGHIIEKKLRHSYTSFLSVFVMSFFVSYWTYLLYYPSEEDKKPCNKNASWIKYFSIFMSVLFGFLVFYVDRHLSRNTSSDTFKGSLFGLALGIGTFAIYYGIVKNSK